VTLGTSHQMLDLNIFRALASGKSPFLHPIDDRGAESGGSAAGAIDGA
jgi:hypothetical protein